MFFGSQGQEDGDRVENTNTVRYFGRSYFKGATSGFFVFFSIEHEQLDEVC